MLILSRREGQSLLIDGEIEIKVTEIVGDKVKLGIAAPARCKILRKELCQTIELNREAAKGAGVQGLRDLIKKEKQKDAPLE